MSDTKYYSNETIENVVKILLDNHTTDEVYEMFTDTLRRNLIDVDTWSRAIEILYK